MYFPFVLHVLKQWQLNIFNQNKTGKIVLDGFF